MHIFSRSILRLFLFLSCVFGYYIEIPSRGEECFLEYVKTKRTAYLRAAVMEVDGSDSDVRLKVYGPFVEQPVENSIEKEFFDKMVNTKKKKGVLDHEGFHFETEHRGGWYKFCLDNKHSSKLKRVDFSVNHGLTNENEMGVEDNLESIEKEGIEFKS